MTCRGEDDEADIITFQIRSKTKSNENEVLLEVDGIASNVDQSVEVIIAAADGIRRASAVGADDIQDGRALQADHNVLDGEDNTN